MAEILPIRRKTLSNQSINQSSNLNLFRKLWWNRLPTIFFHHSVLVSRFLMKCAWSFGPLLQFIQILIWSHLIGYLISCIIHEKRAKNYIKQPRVCRGSVYCSNDVIQYVVLHDIIISVIWSTTQSHGKNASQSTRRGENTPMLNDQMPIRNRIGSIILISEWVGVLFVIFKVLDWYQIKLSMIIDCRNSSSPTNRT